MKVVIMGCGRLGARLAATLDQNGHEVTILDVNSAAFRRLPPTFRGTRAVGNGMDAETLERVGIREAQAFIAVTQGDNRNYFASQLAREVFRVPRVLCRIYDPQRAELFRELGIETYSPTSVGADILVGMLLAERPPRSS
ncbi:Trk system potassium uptake protein TrkA [bacterium HR29]|nr:Trk system potassium uptake protein TrkA [bacterium HR29]